MNLPKIRENLLVQNLNDEVLIYDKGTNKSYCLNSTARTVFNACDGKKTFADLNLPEEIIYLSLDKLKKSNLIASDYVSPFTGINRREVIRKAGLASMIALPIISSLVAPIAAGAQSVAACTTGISQGQGTCLSGQRCVGGSCSACIISGASVPGGCTVTTVARCCSSACNVPNGNCA